MRGKLLAAVFGHFLSNPGDAFVQALGGTADDAKDLRYWPWEAKQDVQYPYAVSQIVSDVDVGAITDDISDIEWQIMIYTETLTEGNNMASLCRKLFSRQELSYDGVCFVCMYDMTVSPMRESNADPFLTTVIFSCYLEE